MNNEDRINEKVRKMLENINRMAQENPNSLKLTIGDEVVETPISQAIDKLHGQIYYFYDESDEMWCLISEHNLESGVTIGRYKTLTELKTRFPSAIELPTQ